MWKPNIHNFKIIFYSILLGVFLWAGCSKKEESKNQKDGQSSSPEQIARQPEQATVVEEEQIAPVQDGDIPVPAKIQDESLASETIEEKSSIEPKSFNLHGRWNKERVRNAELNRFPPPATIKLPPAPHKFSSTLGRLDKFDGHQPPVETEESPLLESVPEKVPAEMEAQEKELPARMRSPELSLQQIKPRTTAKPTITILCYHQFNSAGLYSMSAAEFRQNLEMIRDRGYTVVPLSHVIEFYQGKRDDLPEKSLVITIDDGYRSVYKYAYPILKEFGYPWVFYVYSDYVGSGAGAVTWEQLKEMAQNGMELGGHSKSHPMLTKRMGKSQEEYEQWLYEEIVLSRKIIEEKTGIPVVSFSYPYGAFDAAVREKTIAAGYDAITTVIHANNYSHTDPHELNRFVLTKSYSITRALDAADKSQALPLSGLHPAMGSHLPAPPESVSAKIPEGYSTDLAHLALSIGGHAVKEIMFDPVTRTLTATNLPSGLGERVILKITALNENSQTQRTGTWYFNLAPAKQPANEMITPPAPVNPSLNETLTP